MSVKDGLRRLGAGVVPWLFVLWSGSLLAAPIAEVAETKGVVTAQRGGEARRPIAPGSRLDEGETVVTEANSTAVLAFTDGSKMALRPNTRFDLNQYHFVSSASDSLFFRLLEGGFRTITGAIGKRGTREAYRVGGVTATIGIRGTEYTARECRGDCKPHSDKADPPPIARVASVQGEVTAASPTTKNLRRLQEGSGVWPGEVVSTADNAWIGLVFNDDSRTVLRKGSEFRVGDYRFIEAEPQSDHFAVDLLRGALRAISGRLGKRNPQRIEYNTVTATIGIRGTGFDVWCLPLGSASSATAVAACNESLLVAVRDGRIVARNTQGEAEAGIGEAVYVASPQSKPGLLSPPARLPEDDGAPQPESLPLFADLPGLPTEGDGLYVKTHQGQITLTQGGRTVVVGVGQSALAPSDGSPPGILDITPAFLHTDPFLRAVDFDAVSCTLP